MANKLISDLTAAGGNATATTEFEGQFSGQSEGKRFTLTQVTAVEAAARAAQDDVIEATCGFQSDGSFTSMPNSYNLKDANFSAGVTDLGGATGALTKNLINALRILDSYINSVTSTAFLTTTTYITAEQAKLMYSTVIPCIVCPTGYFIELMSCVGEYTYGSLTYSTGGNDISLRYPGTVSDIAVFDRTNFMEQAMTTGQVKLFKAAAITKSVHPGNLNFYMGANATIGDGTFIFISTYRLHSKPTGAI